MITKSEITANILSYDKWLYRAILAIFNHQTYDEQVAQETKHHNGIGFNGCDAKILSSFAKQIKERGFLSEKQKIVARKKMPKYSGQLYNIAKAKENSK